MLIFINLVIVIMYFSSKFFKKKYNIDTEYLDPFEHVNNTQKWVEGILLIFFVINLAVSFFIPNGGAYLLIFGNLTILLGFRAFMEYKYGREEKEYILTLIPAIGSCIILIGAMFFVFRITTFAEITSDYEPFNPESVEQIEIKNNAWNEDAKDLFDMLKIKREVIVEDKQTINQILVELSKLELRKGFENKGNQDNYYQLTVGDDRFNEIKVYDKYLFFDSGLYKIVGNNSIYEMLEEGQLDWIYPKSK